jgi:hypothetical protein
VGKDRIAKRIDRFLLSEKLMDSALFFEAVGSQWRGILTTFLFGSKWKGVQGSLLVLSSSTQHGLKIWITNLLSRTLGFPLIPALGLRLQSISRKTSKL